MPFMDLMMDGLWQFENATEGLDMGKSLIDGGFRITAREDILQIPINTKQHRQQNR